MAGDNIMNNRGQTPPEYPIAFGIFIFAVFLTLGSLSSVLLPYSSSAQEYSIANSSADIISQEFASEGTPNYILESDCAEPAFRTLDGENPTVPSDCQYSKQALENVQDGSLTAEEFLQLPTKEEQYYIALLDKSSSGSVITNPSTGYEYEIGTNPPDSAPNIISIDRIVLINDTKVILRVIVW
jgi:hypothetical protein